MSSGGNGIVLMWTSDLGLCSLVIGENVPFGRAP